MVLEEEDDAFWTTRRPDCRSVRSPCEVWKQIRAEQRADAGSHSVEHFPAIDHILRFVVRNSGDG
jgi:hypothetical protein